MGTQELKKKKQTQPFQVAISQVKWKGTADKKSPTSTRKNTSRNHSSKPITHKWEKIWVQGLT